MAFFNKNMTLIFLTLVTVVFVGQLFLGVAAELPQFEHPPKDDGSLSVMVVGDWGRRGTHNQSQVALQMGKAAESLEVDFIVSTGDNFYDDGLTNVNDIAFDESFSNVYTAPSLQKKWYSVLGNHDYRGDVLAQLSPVLMKIDSKWFCMRSYIVNAEIAEFFFIDTTPFREEYFTDPEDHTYDWRGVLPREKYIGSLLDDLDEALRESKAKWKIVVGHHTIRSASDHGDTKELVEELLPVLQSNNVHLYVNGHDHCLQHITSPDSALQFLTSGGGSKAWRSVYNWRYPEQMKFFYDGQGFMTLQITQNDIRVAFYDVFGNVLYKWSIINPSHAMI